MSRGLAFPRAEVRDLSEEDDDEDHINFDRSEEDLFISNEAPACLISLSVDLMQTNSSLDLPPIDPIRNQLFDTKRDIYAFNRFDLFRNYVFPHDISLCRLFLNQYELDYEPLLESTSIFSSMIFLDYLPILRGIAINECIGEFVHKTISLTEDSELFNNNDRRIGTRRSRKRGRIHHLEKIIPDYIFKKPYDKTPQDIATKLSESSLIYTKSKNEVDRTNTNEITSKD